MMLLMLATMQVAAVQASPVPLPVPPTTAALDDPDTIVVNARRSRDTADALDRCIARRCPPDEDIAATLAHAETQFLEGDYTNARSTLIASRGRNRGFAQGFPVPVSNLYRALARLSSLNGWRDETRIATIDAIAALKTGLGRDDPRALALELSLGDVYARENRLIAAQQVYASVRKRARKVGATKVEAVALLRSAILYTAVSRLNPEYRESAKAAIRDIRATTDPQLADVRAVVPYVQAQLDIRSGDPAAASAAVASLGVQRGGTPVLVYAPPLDLGLRGTGPAGDGDNDGSGLSVVNLDRNLRDQWADVGFWVSPDGMVRDVAVLRSGKTVQNRWVDMVKEQIGKRRYQRLALAADDPGVYKVERVSLVSDIDDRTGSRIQARQTRPRVEIVDLSIAAPPATSRRAN